MQGTLVPTRLEEANSGFRRQILSPVHCFVDQDHMTYLKEEEQVFPISLKTETGLFFLSFRK